MPRTRPPYPEQFRREAVELVRKAKGDRSIKEIAADLGVTEQSLRTWVKQTDVDAGRVHGLSSEEKEELRRLRREVRVLREEREILKKSRGLLRYRDGVDPVAAFRFIAAEKANHRVARMCQVLGVSRAGFYAWERRAPCDRELTDAWLTEKIRAIHAKSKGTYGSRRVHAELRLEHGIRVGKKRVERLMGLAGLSGCLPRPRKRTTIRVEGVRMAPDLVERDFNPEAPDRLWSADITYIWTLEGWLFLSHVEDLFSRRIVGWEMQDHMRKELVISALEMAVGQRKPEAGCIHHSDKGSQFTAVLFGERCARAGITPSTGSKGDCFDNACSESFHATLKKELIYRHTWATRAQARTAIFEYIEGWYNPHRRHSKLGYLSPAAYEHAYHQTASQMVAAAV